MSQMTQHTAEDAKKLGEAERWAFLFASCYESIPALSGLLSIISLGAHGRAYEVSAFENPG